MIVAQFETSPNAVHAVAFNNQEVLPTETLKVDNNRFSRSAKSSAGIRSNVSVVHHNPTEDRQWQTSRHTVIQNKDSSRLTLDWRNKARLSGKYCAYLHEFVFMLAEF